ncbi:MAG: hypothetical protein EA353_14335 [Puniceicoccaceae bacterium]|nr:MAG: hypothetical protein EA353_14335 [Puniceicoccaceae bacterium]
MEQRLAALPDQIGASLASELPRLPLWLATAGHYLATGLGSSEAAARYFVSLLTTRDACRASFRATGTFYSPQPKRAKTVLVVFSQGLSANACIALEHRSQFAGVVLVTSSTVEGLRTEGQEQKAAALAELERDGVMLIPHPMANEYTILPRFIGPACSLVAAHHLARLVGAEPPDFPDQAELARLLRSAGSSEPAELDAWAAELSAGAAFNFTNGTVEYAQNLAAKVMESLYQPPPICRDVLLHAHGPFQVDVAKPCPQWLFTTEAAAEQALCERLYPLFAHTTQPRTIVSPLPEPFAIFYYECFLNRIVCHAVRAAGIDLIDWPGKGLDGPGYTLAKPYHPKTKD